MRTKRRTKPVRRDEVHLDFSSRIMTLPIDSVRQDRKFRWGYSLEPIPKLWAPLLRLLNQQVQQEWKADVERGWSSAERPPKPIEAPRDVWVSSYRDGKRKCPHCHRKFYAVTYGGAACRYCSDQCADAVRTRARAAYNAPIVKARSIARAKVRANRKCATCGKPIKAQRSTMRFCSVRCRVASHRAK